MTLHPLVPDSVMACQIHSFVMKVCVAAYSRRVSSSTLINQCNNPLIHAPQLAGDGKRSNVPSPFGSCASTIQGLFFLTDSRQEDSHTGAIIENTWLGIMVGLPSAWLNACDPRAQIRLSITTGGPVSKPTPAAPEFHSITVFFD